MGMIDFSFVRNGVTVYEDFKGVDTPLFGRTGPEVAGGGAKAMRKVRGRQIGPTGLKK